MVLNELPQGFEKQQRVMLEEKMPCLHPREEERHLEDCDALNNPLFPFILSMKTVMKKSHLMPIFLCLFRQKPDTVGRSMIERIWLKVREDKVLHAGRETYPLLIFPILSLLN